VEIVQSWFWVILLITLLQITTNFNVQIKSFSFSWMTIVGGILLGLGAYKNKACAIGTISRIGDGNLNYLFTPLGILISLFFFYRLKINHPLPLQETSIITQYPIVFFLISIFSVALIQFTFNKKNAQHKLGLNKLITATSIVAICFVFLLINNTTWAYTQVLSDIAKNKLNIESNRILFLIIFFVSAISCSLFMRTFKLRSLKIKTVFNCFFGGALIGFGSQLIIGSHDSITLYGFPLLLKNAVIAMLLNLFTISFCIKFFGENKKV
jgi:uncharacterized membrane protein YedE/YeeE